LEDLPSPDGSIFKDKEKESESELTPVPLVEERLNVSKNQVMCREAKLIKEPVIETETVTLTYEELIVERRPASIRTYQHLI
jgi:stress response protein YsnF